MDVVLDRQNVFEAIGFDRADAASLKVRADLMLDLRKFIEANGWTQREVPGTAIERALSGGLVLGLFGVPFAVRMHGVFGFWDGTIPIWNMSPNFASGLPNLVFADAFGENPLSTWQPVRLKSKVSFNIHSPIADGLPTGRGRQASANDEVRPGTPRTRLSTNIEAPSLNGVRPSE